MRNTRMGAPLLLAGMLLSVFYVGWGANASFAQQSKSNGSQSSTSDSGKSASKATAPDASLIIPGKSIGHLRLGDSQQQFSEFFPALDVSNSEVTYPCVNGTNITELHWLDLDATIHGEVVAYLQEKRAFEISSSTSQFRTKDGITAGTKPEEVRQKYPDVEAFWLANSRDLASQTRDFVYWVDTRQGIAFEFYYDQYLKERRVSGIYVFEQGKDFIRRGCLWHPKNWRKLAAYSLEPPTESGSN